MTLPEPRPDAVPLAAAPAEQSRPQGEHADSLLGPILQATETSLARTSAIRPGPTGFSPAEISALINAEVVARHADDAPFLWQLRDRAVTAPHYSLHDLAELDERVEASLDGLRVAGDYGWRLAEKALELVGPGEVFTAGVLALESGEPRRLNKLARAAAAKRALQRGLISAAGWVPFELAEMKLREWGESRRAGLRRIAIGAFAVHRRDPGKLLLHLLYDESAVVRARALKAVGELGRIDLVPMVLDRLNDKNRNCRFQAAWAAAVLGDRSTPVTDGLRAAALAGGPYQERALALAVRCLEPGEALQWLRLLWKDPGQLRLAAIGAGALGDPALAGVLIEMMEFDAVARVAGEAFSLITGADLNYLDLNRDGPEHDPTDEQYWNSVHETLHPDDDLPWPAPALVAAWWRANRDKFEAGRRYLCGLPICLENLRQVLLHGWQRQRTAAAMELALLRPGVPLFEVRAPASQQERNLQA